MSRFVVAWPGVPLALLSAALFGISTPFAKMLLGDGLSPWLLAGLLYLGSGLGLGLLQLWRKASGAALVEAPLRRGDLPWLALVVLCGGIIGPLLLMLGLAMTAASTASLLLNLESLATMALAWVMFSEHVDRRLLLGAAAILLGAVVLSWQGGPAGFGWGAVAIAGACVAWGFDNNLTRRLSAADPVQIALIKGLAAGAVNLLLALAAGAQLPSAAAIGGAALIGFVGYGVSLVLFVLGLRHLGAARTGAYFATAPFIGAVVAIALLREPVTFQLVVAGLLMAVGLYLHLAEAHEHEHVHEAFEHEHRHTHDEHHRHEHMPGDPAGEPHTHAHRHALLVHKHPHYPDLHHRHGHRGHAEAH
ncbi:MAG: DMT family transporter [Alphaproteobacteria bacterium]|nr:DMT family transporter [Alphaproteobacteria bacterium]